MSKIKNILLHSRYRKIIYIIVIFFIIAIFSIVNLIYRPKNNTIKVHEKEKITILNKDEWCREQKKYIKNNEEFYPFSFTVKEESNPEKEITRNGYINIRKNAKANILLCHGFDTSKEDMSLLRCLLTEYNIITFDFRAHGENTSSQECTIGYDEKQDVLGVVSYIKNDPKLKKLPLFIYGFSMGAVASILAESDNPGLSVGAIWDCPYESTEVLLHESLKQLYFSLYSYKINLPFQNVLKKYIYNNKVQKIITAIFKLFSTNYKTKINTCIKNTSPINAIKKITIPFLLIGCHNDDKAPVKAIQNMYYSHKENSFVRCWISSGRRHFDALFINPEKYFYKINNFIDTVLSKKHTSKTQKKIRVDKNNFITKKATNKRTKR
jgi:predicted alpha/beta-fold hydrolase